MGSATKVCSTNARIGKVSIHALRGECDRQSLLYRQYHPRFQSTHSVGSATGNPHGCQRHRYVSIHALRGECDRSPGSSTKPSPVSIHALRGECDACKAFVASSMPAFQSTHSVGSATCRCSRRWWIRWRFNPRTPWGVRLLLRCCPLLVILFQSTHSVGSATGGRGHRGSCG